MFELTAKALNILLRLVFFLVVFCLFDYQGNLTVLLKGTAARSPPKLPGESFIPEKLNSLLQLVRAQNPEQ